jgi:hypothetical protein
MRCKRLHKKQVSGGKCDVHSKHTKLEVLHPVETLSGQWMLIQSSGESKGWRQILETTALWYCVKL